MSTPHARNIVRKLLAANQAMRIQELYARGLSEFPATPFPHPPPPKQYPAKGGGLKPAPPPAPNPGHPFRSHAYLKNKVLPELVSTGEVQRFHSVVEPTPGLTPSKKRPTKSKNALESGGVDVWRWRLIGPQAEGPKLEDEPTPKSHDWYLPNQLFSTPEEKKPSTKDPYKPSRWDHLNTRRGNARPEKIRMAKEWAKSIREAREEGTRAAEAH